MLPRRTTVAAVLALSAGCCDAFTTTTITRTYARPITQTLATTANDADQVGNKHGQSSCFLPLLQNDEEYIAPRIVQIAGAYPGADVETYLSLTSEPSADRGQWSYDFSDPSGPHFGTVALPGMANVHDTQDPVALIADHHSLGVLLPDTIKEPVDLIVLCDRARRRFSERKFLVLRLEGSELVTIAAFEKKGDVPQGAEILGHVTLVQIPWLPAMQKRKSGFMEEDTLFN